MRTLKKTLALFTSFLLTSCNGFGNPAQVSSSAPELNLTEEDCFQLLCSDASNLIVPYHSGTLIVDNSIKENDSFAQDHTVVTIDSEQKIGSLYSTYQGGARLSDCYCKVVSTNGALAEYSTSPYYPYHSSYVDENFYRHLITLYSTMRANMSDYDTYSEFINGIGFLVGCDSLQDFMNNTKEMFISNYYYYTSSYPEEDAIKTDYCFGMKDENTYTFSYSINYSTESYTTALKMDVSFDNGFIRDYVFQFGNSTHLSGTNANDKRIIASSFTAVSEFSQEAYDAVRIDGFFAPTRKAERDISVYMDGASTYQDEEGNTKNFCPVSTVRYDTDLYKEVVSKMIPTLEKEVKANCTLDPDYYFDSSKFMSVPDNYVTTSWRDIELYFHSKPDPDYCAVLVNYYNFDAASFEPLVYSRHRRVVRSDIHIIPMSQMTYNIEEYDLSHTNLKYVTGDTEVTKTIELEDQGYIIVDVTMIPKKISDRYK